MRDDKGRFLEGNKGKPKGAKHKSTATVKAVLLDVFREEYTPEKIIEYISELSTHDKLRFLTALLPYISPRATAPEPEPDETPEIDLSKFTDDELRYIAQLQEKARANNTPPIKWGE